MKKYFKTAASLPVLALTLPNHQETALQEYRKKLFQAGAGTFCRFFVPFLFYGWGENNGRKAHLQKPGLTLKSYRTGGLICTSKGLLFLETDLDYSFLALPYKSAPHELQNGFFLGNYVKGTESDLQKIPVPECNPLTSLLFNTLDFQFLSDTITVKILSSRPLTRPIHD